MALENYFGFSDQDSVFELTTGSSRLVKDNLPGGIWQIIGGLQELVITAGETKVFPHLPIANGED